MAWNYEYLYKGCYRDGFPRDLEGGKVNSRSLTLQNCHSRCQPSFLYFGLQVCSNCIVSISAVDQSSIIELLFAQVDTKQETLYI